MLLTKQRVLGSVSMELETAVASMSLTTVEGTTPAIAVVRSRIAVFVTARFYALRTASGEVRLLKGFFAGGLSSLY